MELIKEKLALTEQIREIIKTKGLKKAIKAIAKMLSELSGPLKEWLREALRYLELIEKRIAEELDRNQLLLEEDLKRAEEALEREAEIAKLWMQWALGAWASVEVTWQGVVTNVIENILSDMSFAPR